jgi:hypothetical protein
MQMVGSALPIVFESFPSSTQRDAAGKKREEQEQRSLKSTLSRIVSQYQSLQMHFLDVVKVNEQASAAKAEKLPVAPAPAPPPPPPATTGTDDPDDLVSLSLGTRANSGGGAPRRKGHERSASSSGGTADEMTTAGADDGAGADDEGHRLSLGLGFGRGSGLPASTVATDDDKASHASVRNLSSDSSGSADYNDNAKPADLAAAGTARKSPSAGAGDGSADDEVQQQAKKARVSVRVKCDTPTVRDNNT